MTAGALLRRWNSKPDASLTNEVGARHWPRNRTNLEPVKHVGLIDR